eukprot:jgi/Galph1/5197/GphlegSOOS_G3831.1
METGTVTSKEQPLTGVQETVVGAGRIGNVLAYAPGMKETYLVRRGERIPDGSGPIYVCTRNDDLEDIILQTPRNRRQDLVFVQNGMIQTLLEKHGLEYNTQALIFFAVARKGDKPVDGGGSVVYGKWSEALANRIRAVGCQCTVLNDKTEFLKRMVEKLLWICIMGLLCSKSQLSCGQVIEHSQWRQDLSKLVQELQPIAEEALAIQLNDGVEQRLVEYSKKVADYHASVKEVAWRNGWFLQRAKTGLHASYMKDYINGN